MEEELNEGLRVAAKSLHPDAKWLVSVLDPSKTWSRPNAKSTLLQQPVTDARAECFAALMMKPTDFELLVKSAQKGYAFAQSVLASHSSGDECFRLANLAAFQDERDGHYVLGRCFENGLGCERDVELAFYHFEVAAAQDHAYSAFRLSRKFDEFDSRRFYWLARAHALNFDVFLGEACILIEGWSGPGCKRSNSLFLIGHVFKQGNPDKVRRQLFGKRLSLVKFDFDFHARVAIDFYESQLQKCQESVKWWSLVAIRLGVVKDIRILIAKLVWNERGQIVQ